MRIQAISADIQSWILQGGPKELKLPENLCADRYSRSMLGEIKRATVSCTSDRLFIGSAEKTCINRDSEIVCNIDRFMNRTSESDQYVLVHHEYAGLAGIEANPGAVSDYTISSQLTAFLEDVVVKRLAM